MPNTFPNIFTALRSILKKHAKGMIVRADTPTDFTVITRAIGPSGQPMWFGAVLLKKSAVMYHLMPLYFNPKLQGSIDPALLPRKQGKTCFNFKKIDTELFAKLEVLTNLARLEWARYGFLKPGPISPEQLGAALRAGGTDTVALAKLRKSKASAAARKRAATLKQRISSKTK